MPWLRIGDLSTPNDVPPALEKPLRVIAEHLHPVLTRARGTSHAGSSEGSCILSSLTVARFLQEAGFDATARSVWTAMRVQQGGKSISTLTIGRPGETAKPGRWPGHMVADVSADGSRWLVDTTLYGSMRPEWPMLTGMLALPIASERRKVMGLDCLASASIADGDRTFLISYLDNPGNASWKQTAHARDSLRQGIASKAILNKLCRYQGK